MQGGEVAGHDEVARQRRLLARRPARLAFNREVAVAIAPAERKPAIARHALHPGEARDLGDGLPKERPDLVVGLVLLLRESDPRDREVVGVEPGGGVGEAEEGFERETAPHQEREGDRNLGHDQNRADDGVGTLDAGAGGGLFEDALRRDVRGDERRAETRHEAEDERRRDAAEENGEVDPHEDPRTGPRHGAASKRASG